MRRTRFSHVKKRFLVGRLIKVLFLVASLVLAFFFARHVFRGGSYFIVKGFEIETTGAFVNLEDVNTVVSANVLGKSLIFLDTSRLESTLRETFLVFSSVKVSKMFPDRILIVAIQREPVAAVTTSQANGYYLVDKNGYVLGEVDPLSLMFPLLVYKDSRSFRVGTFMPADDARMYSSILDTLENEDIKVGPLAVGQGTVEFRTRSDVVVLLPLTDSVKKKIELLKQILNKYAEENKILKKVDLRYDNVVVE